MRTQKQLKRLVSIALVLCTLFALCMMPASAEQATTTTTDKTAPAGWKITMPTRPTWGEGNFAHAAYPADSGVEMMYFYQGTDSADSTKAGFNSDWQEDSSSGEFRNVVPNAKHVFYYGCWFAPNTHYSPAVAYTAPYTGLLVVDFNYTLDKDDISILVGKDGTFNTNDYGYYAGAYRRFTKGEVGEDKLQHGSVTIPVTAGEKVYFLIDHISNGNMATFWIEKICYQEQAAASWKIDNGDIDLVGGRSQFYTNEAFDYFYYYKGTAAADGVTTAQGIYNDFKLSTTKFKATASESTYYEGSVFAPQCHFGTGVSFTAPYTGKVSFTFQYKLPNAEHHIVVGKDNKNYRAEWNWWTDSIWAGWYANQSAFTTSLQTNTVSVDMVAGETIYFYVVNQNWGYETNFWVKSAEYVSFGEPTTVLGLQQSSVQDGKFDVRLISAVNSLEYVSIGYTYSVKYTNGENVKTIDAVSAEINTVYSALTGNTEAGVKEYAAPQNTYLMAGILENVPATGKVELTFTSWATKQGESAKTEAKTYLVVFENGALKSLSEVTSK